MGANSGQGVAILLFLVAFTCLSIGLFFEGSVLWLLLWAAGLVASVGMFLKVKPLEHSR